MKIISILPRIYAMDIQKNTISFDLELDLHDLMSFQKYHAKNSKQTKWFLLLFRIGFPLYFVKLAYDSFQNENLNESSHLFIPITFIVFAILWIIFMPKLMSSVVQNNTQRHLAKKGNEKLLGTRTMVFDEKGIKVVRTDSEHAYAWTGIRSLGQSQNHYFLYDSTISAIIIPKQKVGSQLKELESLLNSKFKGSEPTVIRTPSLDELLKESQSADAKYQFQKTNKKLWIAVGIFALANVLGMLGSFNQDTTPTIFDSFMLFLLIIGGVLITAASLAFIISLIPFNQWSQSWRFYRSFLITFLIMSGLINLVTIFDLLVKMQG